MHHTGYFKIWYIFSAMRGGRKFLFFSFLFKQAFEVFELSLVRKAKILGFCSCAQVISSSFKDMSPTRLQNIHENENLANGSLKDWCLGLVQVDYEGGRERERYIYIYI